MFNNSITFKQLETQAQYVLARKSETSEDFELLDKLLVHTEGWQHYAFSIFIFNKKGELLLQKRAEGKYHSPGLWTNTCCSHPLSSGLSDIEKAARDRLQEEMGIGTTLHFLFRFEYRVPCGQLIENEIDYVFAGYSDSLPRINKAEVSDFKYISLQDLKTNVMTNPDQYTEWLKIIVNSHCDKLSRVAVK